MVPKLTQNLFFSRNGDFAKTLLLLSETAEKNIKYTVFVKVTPWMEPKGAKSEPKGAKREPKGAKMETKIN